MPEPTLDPTVLRGPRTGCGVREHLTALMVAVARGERSAFSGLYAATHVQVYGLAYRVLRCPEHAADVTQEVYLQVWQQATRFDPARGGVLAWILTLTHRRAVDRVRRSATASRGLERYAADLVNTVEDGSDHVVLARADAHDVRRAVAGLSRVQREALTLAYFGERSGAEIAAQLGVPLGTVKTRIRDGLATLRRSPALLAG